MLRQHVIGNHVQHEIIQTKYVKYVREGWTQYVRAIISIPTIVCPPVMQMLGERGVHVVLFVGEDHKAGQMLVGLNNGKAAIYKPAYPRGGRSRMEIPVQTVI